MHSERELRAAEVVRPRPPPEEKMSQDLGPETADDNAKPACMPQQRRASGHGNETKGHGGGIRRAVACLVHPSSPVQRLLLDHRAGPGKTRDVVRAPDNY